MRTREELLYAPLLKLEWARHHINNLNARATEFLKTKPFVFMERHHRKAGRRVFWTDVRKPVPKEFSLIIGDAVHNMRAGLDVALFGMAGDREPKIHFPFPSDCTTEALKRAIKQGHVKVAGRKVVDAITRLEPNLHGKGIGLHCIHALDIQDKHRLLILAGQRAVIVTGSEGERLLRGVIRKNVPPGIPIVFDAPENTKALVINQRYVTRAMPDSENETNPQPMFAVTFGEGEILAGIPVVQALRRFAQEAEAAVHELVDAFIDPDNKIT